MSALNPDSDGDGLGDAIGFGLGAPPDTDGDGAIDANDPDDDGDTWLTAVEGTGDGDGTPDAAETALGRLDPTVPEAGPRGGGCAASPAPLGGIVLIPLALVRRRARLALATLALAACGPQEEAPATVTAAWQVFDADGPTGCGADWTVELEVAGVSEVFACEAPDGLLTGVPAGTHSARLDLRDDSGGVLDTWIEDLPELGPTGNVNVYADFVVP